jgi:predicted DNA binding protein
MSRTRLRVVLPTDSWLGAVSRASPETTLRVTSTVAADEGDVTALTVAGADRPRAVRALRDHDDADRTEVVERGRAETIVRVTGPPPSYVAAARRVGVPVESPVEVRDGRATLVVVDDRERLSAFGRRLAAAGATVESTGDDESEPVLTQAQREIVRAAIEAGYYDTPRECTLTELAADRDIAKSTCSETLHRAEGRVLRWFVEEEPMLVAGGTDDEPDETAAGHAEGTGALDATETVGVTPTEP